MGTKYTEGESYLYENEYFYDNEEYGWWDNDWWEGQTFIDLVGITPVDDMKEPMVRF